MIPPGLKRAHIAFKFNESMLGKSHRGVGVIVIGWPPPPTEAAYSKSFLNLKFKDTQLLTVSWHWIFLSLHLLYKGTQHTHQVTDGSFL